MGDPTPLIVAARVYDDGVIVSEYADGGTDYQYAVAIGDEPDPLAWARDELPHLSWTEPTNDEAASLAGREDEAVIGIGHLDEGPS